MFHRIQSGYSGDLFDKEKPPNCFWGYKSGPEKYWLYDQANMRFLIAFVALLAVAHGFVPCADVSRHVGHWIGRDQECAALVQTSCHRQPGNRQIGLTSSWRKGLHVREHCGQIPKNTAIATFLGPNRHFDEPHLHQHTAIFQRCEPHGIGVYDQWNGTPINYRVIPWDHGASIQYTGQNYWTVA